MGVVDAVAASTRAGVASAIVGAAGTDDEGMSANGNATCAKDRTSSFHHRSKPFQIRLFVEEIVFRRGC